MHSVTKRFYLPYTTWTEIPNRKCLSELIGKSLLALEIVLRSVIIINYQRNNQLERFLDSREKKSTSYKMKSVVILLINNFCIRNHLWKSYLCRKIKLFTTAKNLWWCWKCWFSDFNGNLFYTHASNYRAQYKKFTLSLRCGLSPM